MPFQKGNKPWNTGLHVRISPESALFKKGHTPANKGKKLSPKTRAKMSESHADVSGKNNPMFGVHRFGDKAANWKGGKIRHGDGYIQIYSPRHPNATNDGYVMEHRLVVEPYIGRVLSSVEQVHHLDRDKANNRPQNLIAFKTNSAHKRFESGRNVPKEEIIFDGRRLEG